MRGLRAISSLSVRLIAATIVSGLPSARGSVVERRPTGIDVRRVDVERRGVARRLLGRPRASAASLTSRFDLRDDRVELGVGGEPFGDQERRQPRDRIARAPLPRARPASCTASRRPTASASRGGRPSRARTPGPCGARAYVDGVGDSVVARDEVGAVDAQDDQARERLDQPRDVAAGRLHFDRHRDRVAVVLDQVDDRQLAVQAVLSDSQNSPSLVVPSPSET